MRDLMVLAACGLIALAMLGGAAHHINSPVERTPEGQCSEHWDAEHEWLPHQACIPLLHATPRNK
jgi:hypothetical protein